MLLILEFRGTMETDNTLLQFISNIINFNKLPQ